MIVDGKKIAHELYQEVASEVATLTRSPVLAAITCAPNFETQKYLELKTRKASETGITLRVIELPDTVTTEEAIACVRAVLPEVDGVVVQLPFPAHVDREALLAAIPAQKDPDGFSYGQGNECCLPPVVGAIDQIAKRHDIQFKNAAVVVLGAGRLVGKPAAHFLRHAGAQVEVLNKNDQDKLGLLKNADIIVAGIGAPHFVTPQMVKEGVIIFDAGTSEDSGLVVGDVHPDVATIATLYTPVPGGIGPITVAVLLRNLVSLVQNK